MRVYYSGILCQEQAIQGNNTNDTLSIVICQSQKEKQGYLIYMIIDSKTDVNTSAFNTYGDVYKNYVEPLLNSITLKESKNVPAINDTMWYLYPGAMII